MKKPVLYMILLLASLHSWSQQASFLAAHTPEGESCRILSDRSIYVAGENIRFSVFYRSPGEVSETDLSKVGYVELISPAGVAYARTKIELDSAAGGSLTVPLDLPSGTYFLKAYTRWMRNYGPKAYTYISVDVVNPFVKTVLQSDTLRESTVLLKKLSKDSGTSEALHVDMPGRFEKRSPVNLDLIWGNPLLPLECCVTVIPEGSLEKQWEYVPQVAQSGSGVRSYIPETRGISITGRIEDDSTGNPVPFAMVYISLMGDERGFICNYADSSGRFFFTLPDSYKEQDLFISAYHKEVGNLRVNIDQDFCMDALNLPSYPIQIGSTDEALIQAMVVNAQIGDQYSGPDGDAGMTEAVEEGYFYGEPSSVIHFDDFIKLPTMEEYLTEVTPQVSVRRSMRRKELRVLGPHPDLNFYDPLIMVDGVAVFDVEAVLAISPGYIERLEVVEAPFVRGNLTFGGIVNLISRKGDMGYIYLPSSGLLVNYSMFGTPQSGRQVNQTDNPRLPDVRNTIYWNPHLLILPGEEPELSFISPEAGGNYQVVVRGFDSSGSYLESSYSFRVD